MTTPMKSPGTLVEAIRFFKDRDVSLAFLAGLRWPDGNVTCPSCGRTDVRFLATRRLWECKTKHARRQFSIKVGTIFEDSPIPLDKWLAAVWLIANAKNGISSYELHRDLKITQKSAWFVLHRIRLAMQAGSFEKLGGAGKVCETDETWIGARARMMNKKQRAKLSKGEGKGTGKRGPYAFSGKTIVSAILERGGRVRARVVPDVKSATLQPFVRANVAKGSALHTDEGAGYVGIEIPTALPDDFTPGDYPVDYIHEAVNHQAQEYVRGNVHTNSVENFWSLLKRTIRGTYVSVEPFHLFRYLDEQTFRFNERKDDDAGRFVSVLRQIVGRRLTYKELTGKLDAAAAPAPA